MPNFSGNNKRKRLNVLLHSKYLALFEILLIDQFIFTLPVAYCLVKGHTMAELTSEQLHRAITVPDREIKTRNGSSAVIPTSVQGKRLENQKEGSKNRVIMNIKNG